jgi:hypothetical protein
MRLPGECPFMFLLWFHRLHGFVRKITGAYPKSASGDVILQIIWRGFCTLFGVSLRQQPRDGQHRRPPSGLLKLILLISDGC